MALTVALTVIFARAFPRIKIDTDPENMLGEDQPDRICYQMLVRGLYVQS